MGIAVGELYTGVFSVRTSIDDLAWGAWLTTYRVPPDFRRTLAKTPCGR